jgi:hypothetical protein
MIYAPTAYDTGLLLILILHYKRKLVPVQRIDSKGVGSGTGAVQAL